MNELRHALKPVRQRLLWLRALRAAQIGLLVGACCALALTVFSFFAPIKNAALLSMIPLVLTPPLLAALAALWPVRDGAAAALADQCGLLERVQTALELKDSENPMALIQRQDTLDALNAFDPKKSLRARPLKGVLLTALALFLMFGGLQFVKNPQASVLKARDIFEKAMQARAQELDKAAKEAMEGTDADAELSKALSELARKLRASRDAREALSALSKSEEEIDTLKKRTRMALREALENAGASDLADALSKDEQAVADALSKLDANAASTLADAAAQASGNASQLLNAAAQALASSASQAGLSTQAGNPSNTGSPTAEQLAQASKTLFNAQQSGVAVSDSQLNALLGAIRSSAVQQAAAQAAASSSSSGQNASVGLGAGGAGQGSTNNDQGTSALSTHSTSSGGASALKMGTYEQLYDPTRLGDGGEVSSVQGQMGEGESSETTLGSGVGTIDESVPYNQVNYDYAQAAAKAAENAALPEYAREWIGAYFDALRGE